MIKALNAQEIKDTFEMYDKDFYTFEFYKWLARSRYFESKFLDPNDIFREYKEHDKHGFTLELAYPHAVNVDSFKTNEACNAAIIKTLSDRGAFIKELPDTYVVGRLPIC